jgi:hypothetical protein
MKRIEGVWKLIFDSFAENNYGEDILELYEKRQIQFKRSRVKKLSFEHQR